jgi:hypothetical protein
VLKKRLHEEQKNTKNFTDLGETCSGREKCLRESMPIRSYYISTITYEAKLQTCIKAAINRVMSTEIRIFKKCKTKNQKTHNKKQKKNYRIQSYASWKADYTYL